MYVYQVTLRAHWLAVERVQSLIPENSYIDSYIRTTNIRTLYAFLS